MISHNNYLVQVFFFASSWPWTVLEKTQKDWNSIRAPIFRQIVEKLFPSSNVAKLNWKAYLYNIGTFFSIIQLLKTVKRPKLLSPKHTSENEKYLDLKYKWEKKLSNAAKYPICILAKAQTSIFSCFWGIFYSQWYCPLIIAWFSFAFVAHVILVLDHCIHQKLDTIFDHQVILKPKKSSLIVQK